MKKNQLKKLAMALVVIMFGFQAFAQGRIDLAPKGTRAPEAQNVSMSGFTATFSFNSIESEQISTEKGVFSIISMDNSVAGGNIGEPEVPVNRKLIAVPFGATPVVTVKNYIVNEYNLADYGIERVFPHQASVSKSEKDPKFAYNEEAYALRGYNEELPLASVSVEGTMRGIQVGALQINAVRYNAAANTIRVYNDIELEVTFENADMALTEKTLVNTYSPYFRTVYATLFNNRAITDIYDEHPDLWATPVKILVVANRMFEETLQPWIQWKTEKGFYLDVNYTDEIGTTAAAIKTFITSKYNEGLQAGQTPTWVIIVGDRGQVPESQMGSATRKVTDLYYYAVAGGATDYYPDMFHSRFTCETTQELQNVLDKSLMYEQYTMPDPSYLDNVLLIAGWDSGWNPKVGKPTIQYAMNYYYNAAHGYANVYNFLQTPYNNPYASMNTGVQFVNYTAHGGDTSWSDPGFSTSNVNSLTNNGKYFLAMGNCCLAANWGYSSKSLGEAMIIAQNKGAYAYIGSPVETYWWEDYYFGVGATHTINQMPTYEASTMGVYDATFRDDFNSISAIPFIGNVAVCYAHANNYSNAISSGATDQYYWEAYHVLGDGSVCPYHTNPIANTVNHLPTLPIGMDTYTISADPGSYVGISKDGVLYGAGEIGEEGTVDLPITPVTSGGDVKIVVTHPQRQPYIATVPAASMTGPYVAVDSYAMNVPQVNYGETVNMDITVKNVGSQTASNITATLVSENQYVTITAAEGSLASLAPDAIATMEGFQFEIAENAPDKEKAKMVLSVTDGTQVWEANIMVTLHAPVLALETMTDVDNELAFTFKNNGSAPFYGGTLSLTSCSPDLMIAPTEMTFEDVIAGGETKQLTAAYSFAPTVEEGTTFEVEYRLVSGLNAIENIFVVSKGVIMEDFESGEFGEGWSFSAQYAWTIENIPGKGTKCARSANHNISSSESFAELAVNVAADGNLTFKYRVSCEGSASNPWDKLTFYMDGNQIAVWTGQMQDFEEYVQPVTAGEHTFKWSYTKDGSVNSGEDYAWIDDIQFPPTDVITFLTPASSLEAMINGANVSLSWIASPDADNYVVKRDGVTIGTVAETSFNDVLTHDGVYTYAVYAAKNGGQLSTPITATVEAEFDGTIEAEAISVSVYPNPASGVLNVVTDAKNYEYQMVNSIGQVVMSGYANGRTTIDVEGLNGVYFLRIVADGDVIVRKVTVK